jgi:probable rRNA maturation factor
MASMAPRTRRKLPPEIEVSLIGSREMRKVHAEFLGDPTVTDVVTFHHGEILVCPEVAKRQGRNYGRTVEEETSLYGIHGLLHLAGYTDHTERGFRRMAAAQEELFRRALARLAPATQ